MAPRPIRLMGLARGGGPCTARMHVHRLLRMQGTTRMISHVHPYLSVYASWSGGGTLTRDVGRHDINQPVTDLCQHRAQSTRDYRR
jgi:hypothetical protein